MKKWNIVRITKIWQRDMKWAKTFAKMAQIDFFNIGLPQTFGLFKKRKKLQSVECSKAKYNEMRYACDLVLHSSVNTPVTHPGL